MRKAHEQERSKRGKCGGANHFCANGQYQLGSLAGYGKYSLGIMAHACSLQRFVLFIP